jgi:hypothetical protein
MKLTSPLFPSGVAGLGLLLLRLSAALLLVSILIDIDRTYPWAPLPLGAVAIAISLGLATRIAAGLCAAVTPFLLIEDCGAPGLLVATHALDALALLLLGPGALSIDARLFGRRTIGLP